MRGSAATGLALLRTRTLLPAVLAGMVVVYEFVWRGRLLVHGPVLVKVIDLGLFLVVGPAMAWWGLGAARSLLQRLARSEAISGEKSRLLEQRNRQLQTVLQASRAMLSVLDLSEAANQVVGQVVTYTRFVKALLVLGPDAAGDFALVASHGLPAAHLDPFMAALRGPHKASSPVEWCRLTRQPVVVEDLKRDFRTAALTDIFAMASVEGMIAVPLIWNDLFRGALLVYLETGGPISTAEISLVSALAAQAALTLENARLYTVTARNHTRLDRALAFLETAASALARTQVGVSPLLQLVARASAQLFAPACVHLQVARAGRTEQVVEEAMGMDIAERSALTAAAALPVTLDGELFGRFEVYLKGEGRRLDEDEVRILQAFVHLTASALGNAIVVADMRQAVDEVERAYMGTLEALIKALEIRDHETEGHSRRVVQYTLSLAQYLGVAEAQLVPIMRGALLHDIGKIGIPDAILRKPGPLTEQEWTVMKQHTRFGYRMLKGIEFLHQAIPIILHHHERFDGTGYPDGLAAEDIPLGARIFAVADAYDAITSNRPYRKGRSHELAVAEIRSGAATQFDPVVVDALLSLPVDEMARIRGRDLELVRP